jgi:hypothetical protein
MWPRSPISIQPAWIHGKLFEGPGYPAFRCVDPTSVNQRVQGELWNFHHDDVAEVARVLDQIEGTNQSARPNLYDRILIDTFDLLNQPLGNAWCFEYAIDPIIDGFKPVQPDPSDGFAQW